MNDELVSRALHEAGLKRHRVIVDGQDLGLMVDMSLAPADLLCDPFAALDIVYFVKGSLGEREFRAADVDVDTEAGIVSIRTKDPIAE